VTIVIHLVTATLKLEVEDDKSPIKLTNTEGELTLTRLEWDTLIAQAIVAYKADPEAFDKWNSDLNSQGPESDGEN
jgi:hypothetical protein